MRRIASFFEDKSAYKILTRFRSDFLQQKQLVRFPFLRVHGLNEEMFLDHLNRRRVDRRLTKISGGAAINL